MNPFTITAVMGESNLLLRLTACVSMMILGCDKSKPTIDAAKPVADTKPSATQEAKPTTQELTAGKQKRLRLPNTPLSLMVPESWKIDSAGPVTFVTGPSFFGTATIGLSSPGSVAFKQNEIDSLVSKLSADASTHPEQFRREEHRTVGSVQVIEKRFLKKPVTRDKLDEKGDPISDNKNGFVTVTSTPVQWTLTLFVPADTDFSRYELNLIDMDADQLTADEKLLDKIIGSVTVDGAPRSAATAP